MNGYLRQSTAVTVRLGPAVDSTDGNTEKTALTIAQADVRVSKGPAGTWGQKDNATACTAREHGYYTCPLSTTDTDTLGVMEISVHVAGMLIAPHYFEVLPAAIWDARYGVALPVLDYAAIADAVWDEVLSGHTVIGSAAWAAIHFSGVARAGTANTIQLATTAPAIDGWFVGKQIVLESGPGAVQAARCTGYVGSTRICTMETNWTGTNPGTTTSYVDTQ